MGRKKHVAAVKEFIVKSQSCSRLKAYACHQLRISKKEPSKDNECKACHLTSLAVCLKRKRKKLPGLRVVKKCTFCGRRTSTKISLSQEASKKQPGGNKQTAMTSKQRSKGPRKASPSKGKQLSTGQSKESMHLSLAATDNLRKLLATKTKSSMRQTGLLDSLIKKV